MPVINLNPRQEPVLKVRRGNDIADLSMRLVEALKEEKGRRDGRRDRCIRMRRDVR